VLLAVPDGDQDVGRLHVAVDEPAGVSRVERRRALLEQLHSPSRIERSLLDQHLVEISADHVVHHEEQQPFVLAGIVDADDVGMVQ